MAAMHPRSPAPTTLLLVHMQTHTCNKLRRHVRGGPRFERRSFNLFHGNASPALQVIDDAVGLVPRGVGAAREQELAVFGPLAPHTAQVRARDVLHLRRSWPGTAEHDLQNVTLWCGGAWPAAEAAVSLAVNAAKISGPEMDTTDPEYLSCLPPGDGVLNEQQMAAAKECGTGAEAAEEAGGAQPADGGGTAAKPWLIAVIVAAGVLVCRCCCVPAGPDAIAVLHQSMLSRRVAISAPVSVVRECVGAS